MIRELIAILILLLILAAAILDIHTVVEKCDELSSSIEDAKQLSISGNDEGAENLVRKSQKAWQDWSVYANVMLRHADSVSDLDGEYYALLEKLQNNEASPAAFDILISSLERLTTIGMLSVGSIF